MIVDEYGQVYLSNKEVTDKLYGDQNFDTTNLFLEDDNEYNLHKNNCTLFEINQIQKPNKPNIDPVEYHKLLSADWHMPDTYKNLDVLDFCCKKSALSGSFPAARQADTGISQLSFGQLRCAALFYIMS